MDGFEFIFTLFGVVLGLTLAGVLGGFARARKRHGPAKLNLMPNWLRLGWLRLSRRKAPELLTVAFADNPAQSPNERTLGARWTKWLTTLAPADAICRITADIHSVSQDSFAVSRMSAISNIDVGVRMLAEADAAGWSETLAIGPRARAGLRSGQAQRLELDSALGQPQRESSDLLGIVRQVEVASPPLPSVWWIAQYARLMRGAHVAAAFEAKRAAARSVIASIADGDVINRADMLLAAAIALNSTEAVDEAQARIRASLARGSKPPDRLGQIWFDAALAAGRFDEALASANMQDVNSPLGERLGGCTIALVGPACNALENGKAIDATDVVVRTNFIANAGFDGARNMVGSRTDLSYYNNQMMRVRGDEIISTLRHTPSIIGAFRSDEIFEKVRLQCSETAVHRSIIFDHVFFGRGYAMRHVIADLLRVKFRRLKVYGVDFFINPETHYSGYVPGNANQVRSYIRHDPLDTWRFLKCLRTAGRIHADGILSPILDLDEGGFAAALSDRIRTYGGRRSRPARTG